MGSEYDYQKIAGYLKEKDINNFRLVSRLHRRSSEQRFQRMRSYPRIEGYLFSTSLLSPPVAWAANNMRGEYPGGIPDILILSRDVPKVLRVLKSGSVPNSRYYLESKRAARYVCSSSAKVIVYPKDHNPEGKNYYVRTRTTGAIVISRSPETALEHMNELVDDGVVSAATRNYVTGTVNVVEP